MIEANSHIAPQASATSKGLNPEQARKWKVAKDFEAMFLNEMMKSMRKTVSGNDLTQVSQGRKVFTEMLDKEYADMASRINGGSGLAGLLYEQLSGGEKLPKEAMQSLIPDTMQSQLNKIPASFSVNNAVESSDTSSEASGKKGVAQWDALIKKASEKFGISENMIRSVMQQESGGNRWATSPVGARGLMQLMDPTARELGVQNSYDPEQNIMGGAKYLKQMLNMFSGDRKLALAAYNAGPGNVRKYDGIPPFKETQHYVKSVSALMDKFAKTEAQEAQND